MTIHWRISLAAAILMAVSSSAQADATGVWRTEKGKDGAIGIVQIHKCGSQYCGKIVGAIGKKPRIGLVIVKDMKKDGKTYSGGQIYAPDDDRWYSAKMVEQGAGKLKVSGCVLGGLICRGQVWTRQK
ncbi:DUF2147 domain-containing protein [Coralliovum pocilloporae]|uniref:DUF2147 domain-containing protein n=1 Tax=Coralliovum pocilloporae TaxID=3066369 RepID=UPI003306C377